MSYDGPVVTGLGALARTPDQATQAIKEHLDSGSDGQDRGDKDGG